MFGSNRNSFDDDQNNFNEKKKNNIFTKKNIILIVVVVVLAIISLVLYLFNSSKRKVLLTCTLSKEGEYATVKRDVLIYKKSGDLYYEDNIDLVELKDDKNTNSLLEMFIIPTETALKNNPDLSYTKKDNKINVHQVTNLSKHTMDELDSLIGTVDISIDGLKTHLEEDDLICTLN